VGECFFLVPGHPGSPGQRAIKWLFVVIVVTPKTITLFG